MNFEFSDLLEQKNTFVIAEAGSNWKKGTYNEDIKEAKMLIDVAFDANADAVKFQTFEAESLYAHDAGHSDYLQKSGITENVNEMFEILSMPKKMIPELAKHCERKGILFMSTPFSVKDAKQIDPFTKIYKIASYEINHVRLLEFIASTLKPVIISTGASTYEDIDFAFNIIKKYHNKIAILQCTAKYPAPLETMNLSVIPSFRSKYNCPVGLSDHSTDPIISPLTAIGFGASIIEKHFTINKNNFGPDHKFSLEPNELKLMIDHIRKADKTKGIRDKKIIEEEKELKKFATRSLQAIKNIEKGEILKEGENFDVLRPGNQKRGLDAKLLLDVNGKRSTQYVKEGEGIIDYE